MDDNPPAPRDDTDELVRRATSGDDAALAKLFGRYRKRLRQMVRLRLDRRLQGRVDPSDVLQEAYIDLAQRLPGYVRERSELPFYLWLRLVAGERLLRIHRQHLGTAMRDAGREVSLYRGALPQASSVSLAGQLLGRITSPSHALIRAEVQLRLQEALNAMDPIDREVIDPAALRGAVELRGRRGLGRQSAGGQQPVPPGHDAVARGPQEHPRSARPGPGLAPGPGRRST